jgi:hypothetical protein
MCHAVVFYHDWRRSYEMHCGLRSKWEVAFRRANGYSKDDMKQHIREEWIEHDILDAQLDVEKAGPGGMLLISRQRDKRYTLQLLSRKTTSAS